MTPVMWSETVGLIGQDRSETKKIGLGLGLVQFLCCVVKYLVTLVVIMVSKVTVNFQVLFIVSLFCIWSWSLFLVLEHHYCGSTVAFTYL